MISATACSSLLLLSLFGQTAVPTVPSEAPQGLRNEQSLPSRYPHVVQDILKHCQPQSGFWVDLGAGQGQLTIPLIQATGNPVVMVDPDAEALTKGLAAARDEGLANRLTAVVGVAEALPFPDNSVDLLVSRGAIFFFQDAPQGLREVYRVLRPGGKAYLGGGAGSGYPADATQELIQLRQQKLTGKEAEKWQRFVALREPEQMRQWAEQAGLADYQIMGKGAVSAEDQRVGQGVWIMFEKKPEVTLKKSEDSVRVEEQDDQTVYTITSPSGIGEAELVRGTGWPKKITVRLRLRGLESLTISNGEVTLTASIASTGDHGQIQHVQRGDETVAVASDSPLWMGITAHTEDGGKTAGLPTDEGYFEVLLPTVLTEGNAASIILRWIDFYR